LHEQVGLDLAYRYVSSMPDQQVQAYSTGDVQLRWRFHPQWELSAVGRNLLQPHHAEFGGDNPLVEIKRSGYAQLTWTR
jgi:iron complex outermembrane receptor protein